MNAPAYSWADLAAFVFVLALAIAGWVGVATLVVRRKRRPSCRVVDQLLRSMAEADAARGRLDARRLVVPLNSQHFPDHEQR